MYQQVESNVRHAEMAMTAAQVSFDLAKLVGVLTRSSFVHCLTVPPKSDGIFASQKNAGEALKERALKVFRTAVLYLHPEGLCSAQIEELDLSSLITFCSEQIRVEANCWYAASGAQSATLPASSFRLQFTRQQLSADGELGCLAQTMRALARLNLRMEAAKAVREDANQQRMFQVKELFCAIEKYLIACYTLTAPNSTPSRFQTILQVLMAKVSGDYLATGYPHDLLVHTLDDIRENGSLCVKANLDYCSVWTSSEAQNADAHQIVLTV
ncbi:hypothetical protein [Aliagarivorans taiwanensis]|uniref:hypothetical protein n=1 Tax=Aliagarivorans taiwanensis TaxID=561966 RepID=UPI00041199E8|nr:hypothetical protein [Aliagarivorans taiwanensis]